MRPFALFFTLVVVATVLVAVAIGIYFFFRKKRDGLTPRDSYYPSSSFNSGATWTQTQQVYRPPPPSPSYTRNSYPPATHAHSQTAPRTPTPPDVYHSSVTSPYTRTPSQTQPSSAHARPSSILIRPSSTLTQPSSTRTQASRQHSSLFNTVHVHELPEHEYFQTSSHVSSLVHTGSEPCPPTVPAVVSSDPRSDEPAGVEDLNDAEKLREQARRRGREMSEAYSQAESAQRMGDRRAAQEYRRQAGDHKSDMEELDKRAAKIIFREKNKVCS